MIKYTIGGAEIRRIESELKRRGVCFFISIIVHAIFIYLLFSFKFTVKIFPDKRVVREVVLVSPEKIFIPENIENYVKESYEKGHVNNIEFLDFRLGSKVERDQSLNQVNRKNIKDKTDDVSFKSDIPF